MKKSGVVGGGCGGQRVIVDPPIGSSGSGLSKNESDVLQEAYNSGWMTEVIYKSMLMELAMKAFGGSKTMMESSSSSSFSSSLAPAAIDQLPPLTPPTPRTLFFGSPTSTTLSSTDGSTTKKKLLLQPNILYGMGIGEVQIAKKKGGIKRLFSKLVSLKPDSGPKKVFCPHCFVLQGNAGGLGQYLKVCGMKPKMKQQKNLFQLLFFIQGLGGLKPALMC